MPDDTRTLYLKLLKRSLTGTLHAQTFSIVEPRSPLLRTLWRPAHWVLSRLHVEFVRTSQANSSTRRDGHDWPLEAETMVGLTRLNNLQECLERILADNVAGDVIECGVWRGGAAIFMRGVLRAYASPRTVWVADSFRGLPKPHRDAPRSDVDERLWSFEALAVPLDNVRANFARYNLLDHQVRFLVGWFEDTLPTAPIEQLALLRLDGDMYSSTRSALDALYPKVNSGGFCIVDDYFAIPGTRQAVDDYRAAHHIIEPIQRIDWTGAFWRRA